LDAQNYHDPEQLCLEEWEFDFLEIEINQKTEHILHPQSGFSNQGHTSKVQSEIFFKTEAL